MVAPPSWFDVGGKGGLSTKARCADNGYEANNCKWFTNRTFISGEPTLPKEFRTYQDLDIYGFKVDFTKVKYLLKAFFLKKMNSNLEEPLASPRQCTSVQSMWSSRRQS